MASSFESSSIPASLAGGLGFGHDVATDGQRKPPRPERLLNAREVAAELGVSERWVRDHTTRRNPMIRAVKLGSLIRYKRADVDAFMESLATDSAFSQRRVRA